MALAKKKIQRIGNSTGVIFPAEFLAKLGWKRGDEVILHAEDGVVTLKRIDAEMDAWMDAADRVVAAHPAAFEKLAQ